MKTSVLHFYCSVTLFCNLNLKEKENNLTSLSSKLQRLAFNSHILIQKITISSDRCVGSRKTVEKRIALDRRKKGEETTESLQRIPFSDLVTQTQLYIIHNCICQQISSSSWRFVREVGEDRRQRSKTIFAYYVAYIAFLCGANTIVRKRMEQ